MSVFNPKHTSHPPGHVVHMSRKGTTASCQCLIPRWICLNQTYAWMDICVHTHRQTHTLLHAACSDYLLCQFPGLCMQEQSLRKCLFRFISRLVQRVSVILGLTHQITMSSGLPRQQPTPIPCQHFATCHSLPLFMIRNRCWRVYPVVWTQISCPESVCVSWTSDSWGRGLYLWRNSMAAERRGDPEGGLMVPLLPAQR